MTLIILLWLPACFLVAMIAEIRRQSKRPRLVLLRSVLSPLFAFVFLAILKPKPDRIRIVLPTPDPMLIEHEPQHVATVLASDGHGCRIAVLPALLIFFR